MEVTFHTKAVDRDKWVKVTDLVTGKVLVGQHALVGASEQWTVRPFKDDVALVLIQSFVGPAAPEPAPHDYEPGEQRPVRQSETINV
jgi:hypothetical protein